MSERLNMYEMFFLPPLATSQQHMRFIESSMNAACELQAKSEYCARKVYKEAVWPYKGTSGAPGWR